MLNLPFTLAVLVQLYRMASSPNALPGPMVPINLPPFKTSSCPSVMKQNSHLGLVKQQNFEII